MAFNGWGSFAGGLAQGFNETARTMALLREGQQRQQQIDAALAQKKLDQASLQAIADAAKTSDTNEAAFNQDRMAALTLGQKLHDLAGMDPKLRGPIVDQYVADIQKQTGAVLAMPVVKILKSADAQTLQGLVGAASGEIAANPTIGFTGLVSHLSNPQTATDALVGLIKRSGVAQQATEMGQPAPETPTDPLAGIKLQLSQLQARRDKIMAAASQVPSQKGITMAQTLVAPLDAQIGKLQDIVTAGPKAAAIAEAQAPYKQPTTTSLAYEAAGKDPRKALAIIREQKIAAASAQGAAGQKYLDERKLGYYRSLGLPEPDIRDLVYGITRLTPPDPLGNSYIVNLRTGETKQVVGQAATAGPTPEPTAAAGPPLGMSATQAATEGSGPWAAGRQLINNTFGAFFSPLTSDAPFPETAKAKNVLQYVRNAAKAELVTNRKAPVYDQKQVEDMVPTGQAVFEDPHIAISKLQTLKQNLEFKKRENENSLANARITPSRRADLTDQIDGINHILTLLSDVPGQGQEPSIPPDINDLLKKYGQ